MKDMPVVQALVFVFAWLVVAIINGIRDHYKDGLPFWKRPVTLLVCWVFGTLGVLCLLAIEPVGNYFESIGYAVFGVIPVVLCFILGIIWAIGGIGCSFFIPWTDSYELDLF